MTPIRKILFAGGRGTCREPMAMILLQNEHLLTPLTIEARGLVVLFPEPVNQKADAVLASHNLKLEAYASSQLESSDFGEDTVILTFDSKTRENILAMEGAQNVFILTEVTGDELEIMDPYGGDLMSYGLCYETMSNTIHKLAMILNEKTLEL